jgi:hypothetical protein
MSEEGAIIPRVRQTITLADGWGLGYDEHGAADATPSA